ncbi:MAG: YfhO family protein [Chloroflexota bacterium]
MKSISKNQNGILWFVFLAPFSLFLIPMIKGNVIFWGTAGLQFIPWRAYGFALLEQGIFPFWNPLNGMGAPLFANYQTAFLYPLSWILYPIYHVGGVPALAWGFTLLVPVHLGLAGVGTALLLRELGINGRGQLVAGLAFGLCGYFVARASFFSMIWAGAWLPWLIWAVERVIRSDHRSQRWMMTIGLALIAANQLFAGHAQLSWYSLVFAVLWMIFRVANKGDQQTKITQMRFLAAGILLAVLLASIQLFPTFEYLLQSQRSSAVDYEYAVNYSLWPWRLLGFFLPDLFGNPGTGNYWGYGAYWEDALYIGFIPILLALSTIGVPFRKSSAPDWDITKQRVVRFLWAIVVIATVFSLGKNTPVFPWLYRNIPTFDMFQAPTRWMYLAVFSLTLLAGFGAHSWERPTGKVKIRFKLLTVAALATGIGALAGSLLLPQIEKTFVRSFMLLAGLLFSSSILGLLAPAEEISKSGKQTVWNFLAAGLILLDLWVAGISLNPFINMGFFDTSPSALTDGNPRSRVYIPPSVEKSLKFEKYLSFRDFNANSNWEEMKLLPLPNMNLLSNVAMVNNFDPLVPKYFEQWMEKLDDLPSPIAELQLRKMGVGMIIQLDDQDSLNWRVQEIKPDPIIGWKNCQRIMAESEETLNLMLLQALQVTTNGECIIVEAEESCDIPSKPSGSPARVELLRDEVNLLEVMVSTDSTGWVRIADSWYPGWTATIDGEHAVVERVDYLFKGVCVPAGNHTVILRYQPTGFPVILGISLATLLFCITLSLVVFTSQKMRSKIGASNESLD